MSPREKDYDAVDACVFSSDMLYNAEDRAIFASYLARWNTAFGETQEPTPAALRADVPALPPASEAPAVPRGDAAALEAITKRMVQLTALMNRASAMPIMNEWQWLNHLRNKLLAAPRPKAPTPSAAVATIYKGPRARIFQSWEVGVESLPPGEHKLYALDTDRAARASDAEGLWVGTASMYAQQHKLAVTNEWMRGWNACLDAIDAARAAQKKETP